MRDTSRFYKEGYFWIDPSQPWDIELYGKVTNNKFDLIFNTCDKIIMDNDTSEWAHGALYNCAELLRNRRRWPYYMDQEGDPKTRLWWRLSRLLYWLYLIGPVKVYGHPKRMSRDPFINFFTTCTLLDQMHHIKNITIPWWLYRPNTWRWIRRLIKDNRKDYVKRLDYLRAKAIVLNTER